jgi:hypothetical protein
LRDAEVVDVEPPVVTYNLLASFGFVAHQIVRGLRGIGLYIQP